MSALQVEQQVSEAGLNRKEVVSALLAQPRQAARHSQQQPLEQQGVFEEKQLQLQLRVQQLSQQRRQLAALGGRSGEWSMFSSSV